ncbi:MAG: glycosyltransferase [Steroidobacteraceae bacterium]
MNRRLNIVSVCRSLPTPDDPSAGIFVRNRLEGMAELADLRVVQPIPYFPVAAPLPAWARNDVRVSGQIDVLNAPMFYIPGVAKSLDARWLARSIGGRLARLHKERPIDIVDAHFGYPDGVGCMYVARRLGIPLFVTLRGFEKEFIDRPRIGQSMMAAFHAATGLIAVSHSLRRFAIEHGVPPQKIRVVHNAIDARQFSAGDRDSARRVLDIRPEVPLVLSVGHLIPRKRHHVLLEAFSRLLAGMPAARLVIIGSATPDAAYATRLRELAGALGIEASVTFAGNLPPVDVVNWLRAADVFALATAREGCCNAVLEALAVGVPVVTTPVGDNAEFVADGRNGFLFPVDDVEALTNVLRASIARGAWDRGEISGKLHASVGEWPEVASRVLEFMRESIRH